MSNFAVRLVVDTAFALSAGFLCRVGRERSCQASLLFFFILRPQVLRTVNGRYDYYSQLASAPLSLLVVLRVSAWSSGMLRRLLCGAAVTQGRRTRVEGLEDLVPDGRSSRCGQRFRRVRVRLPPLPACGAAGMANGWSEGTFGSPSGHPKPTADRRRLFARALVCVCVWVLFVFLMP